MWIAAATCSPWSLSLQVCRSFCFLAGLSHLKVLGDGDLEGGSLLIVLSELGEIESLVFGEAQDF